MFVVCLVHPVSQSILDTWCRLACTLHPTPSTPFRVDHHVPFFPSSFPTGSRSYCRFDRTRNGSGSPVRFVAGRRRCIGPLTHAHVRAGLPSIGVQAHCAHRKARMYRGEYQSGFFSVLYSIGRNPLEAWAQKGASVREGSVCSSLRHQHHPGCEMSASGCVGKRTRETCIAACNHVPSDERKVLAKARDSG